jgi:hypothetical protein
MLSLPYAGWLLALALVLWLAKEFFGKLVQDLATRSSERFARVMGQRPLGRQILKRYRSAVIKNYGEHALGFGSLATVNVTEVYVPLQYLDEQGYRQGIDETLVEADRRVILGEPGAGKSLLLKYLLTTWAADPARDAAKIPVLIELHRCNDREVALIDLIRDEFSRNGVRGREASIDRALGDGDLLILLDGLDEVARDHQTRVVNLIKDFVATWDSCGYLATCRIAVYTGQLVPHFPATLSITDFDDADIRRLLAKWPDLSPAEADRFFIGLAENPQLMRLAGSPLLLTMMIYLHTQVYAKAGRTLPGSRSGFYDLAVNHLLRRDRDLARNDALSIYEGSDKIAALQRVALALQQTPAAQPDRRSIEHDQLIEIVRQVATRLNLRDTDIRPLIDEIVVRSQLLVKVGRSSRYVFRHLTLQEFLAARELQNNPGPLLAGYHADPDGWRETMRLWCGVTGLDCTAVVEEIFAGDDQEKVLALQCVAEAANIDPGFAERVVGHFIELLRTEGSNPAIESALGAVAADDRPRARAVLARLEDLFLSGQAGSASAARTLGATRLPLAAQILGRRIAGDDAARGALRTMGEQAVPVLAVAAADGDLRSVDDLGEIATASAAVTLTALIWRNDDVAFRAAWWIAALIRRPEVEDGLRQADLGSLPDLPILDWVWRPMLRRAILRETPLSRTMGRVAWLLSRDVADHAPESVTIDLRLVVPLVALELTAPAPRLPGPAGSESEGGDLYSGAEIAARNAALAAVNRGGGRTLRAPGQDRVVEVILDLSEDDPARAEEALLELASALPPARRRVLQHAPPAVRFAMVRDHLVYERVRRRLTVHQWTEATVPVHPPRSLVTIAGLALTSVGLLGVGLAAYRVLGPRFGATVTGPSWVPRLSQLGLAVVGLTCWLVILGRRPRNDANGIPYTMAERARSAVSRPVTVRLAIVGVGTCEVVAFYTVQGWIGWPATLGITLAIAAGLGWLWWIISRRYLQIANPFRKYLTLSEAQLVSRERHLTRPR